VTESQHNHDANLTRRTFVVRGAQGSAALAGLGLLAGCGSSSTSPNSGTTSATSAATPGVVTSTGTGTPKRGGTVTLGCITSGPTLPLNPLTAFSPAEGLQAYAMFDSLYLFNDAANGVVPRLALSAEPNADASVWTLKLRSGVVFHDGKPLTADDVIWSLKMWANPLSDAAGIAQYIDAKRLRKRGPLTVEVPLIQPIADWPATTCLSYAQQIVPEGSTFKTLSAHPIGTGAFRFVSQEGNTNTLAANPDYWEPGKPYVDKLVFNQQFTDDTARLNALLAGQIDIDFQSSWLQTKQQISNPNVTVLGHPNVFANGIFIMRVDKGPLSDVRMRQAMKLIADRPALCEGASAGFANVGNDLLGYGAQYFANDLQRHQDIEQAKSLIKAAGQTGATIVLATSPYADGVVQAATLLAQQASAAGITIKVKVVSPATYFTPPGGLGSGSFRQDTYDPVASLGSLYLDFFTARAFNETHWGQQFGGAAGYKLINEAIAATDPSKAQQLWHAVQLQQFNQGGFLVWGNAYVLSLIAKRVKGLTESRAGFLNSGQALADMWVE
jgi:peptide/nickel transport system substrate-binding protein